ncbi:unnamed protein product [Blepharisma stoltei]|uniref:3'-5' exonuclease domain-containing protein n=1 Tax=Blepharisma stoltei TaxID=1481888 RepID=A0AAU9K7P7_9CILI|nr:unnamed protein product [Blepharisma stoltei]
MDWYQEALSKFCNSRPPSSEWVSFIDSINYEKPHLSYGYINEYLLSKTFLTGPQLSSEDFYLAYKLKNIPSFAKLLTSKLKPQHLCRWFHHIFTIFPDESYEIYKKHAEIIDSRLIEALKSNDMKKFQSLLGLVNINARDSICEGPRPIHIACKLGNFEALNKLIENGASIETLDEEGLTPIFYAVKCKNIEMFKYLVTLGANVFHIENQKRSLFFWAASAQRLDILDILIEKGCDANARTILGRTALSKAAWNGAIDIIKYLLKIPEIQLNTPDGKLRTPLHNAVWGCAGGRLHKKMGKNSNDCPEAAELLLDHGADIEAMDDSGNTPLCIAASTKAENSLKLLIARGGNVYHQNSYGYPPLHQACYRGHVDCVQILLDYGVDINSKCKNGWTSLEDSIHFNKEKVVDLLLSRNAICDENTIKIGLKDGKFPIIQKLFSYSSRNPDDFISYCLEEGNDENTLWVLENSKRDINLEELRLGLRRSKKIADLVLGKWDKEIPNEILEMGIEFRLEINDLLSQLSPTARALHLAISKGNEALALKMIEKDNELWKKTDESTGQTALHIAARYGKCQIAANLVKMAWDPIQYITLEDKEGLNAIMISEIHNFPYFSALLRDLYKQASQKEIFSYVKNIEFTETSEPVPKHPLTLEEMQNNFYSINATLKEIKETETIWVDTQELLESMKSYFQDIKVIGFDLEYHNFDAKKGCICLVQISSGEKDFVVDLLTNRKNIGEFLRNLMLDQEKLKIFHGSDSDLAWLQNDFSAFAVNIFDTARAYKIIAGEIEAQSLASLINIYLGIKIDKTFQIADWRIRPIPKPMLEYARCDAHYLPFLYLRMKSELSAEQLELLANTFNAMCQKSSSSKLTRVDITNCG